MTLARQVIHVDPPGAHVDEVGDVVDVVFAYSRVGGRQIQQVVVPGLGALQLVLRILCLPLEEGKMDAGSPHQGRGRRRGRGRLTPSIPGGLGVRLGDRDGETCVPASR